MANVNNVVLSGSIAMDPDLRWISEDGEAGITRLGLIVRKSRKLPEPLADGTEWEETSSIFDVEVYSGFALTIARKLKKFDEVTVSGELVKDEWEDKDSGGNRSRIKVIARVIDSPGLFRAKAEDRDLRVGQQQQFSGHESAAKRGRRPDHVLPKAPAQTVIEAAASPIEPTEITADDIPF